MKIENSTEIKVNIIVDAVWKLIKKIFFWNIIILGGVYVIFRLRFILFAILTSILLTYVLLPSVDWLCRFNIKSITPKAQRLFATILVFAAFFTIIGIGIDCMVAPFKNELIQFQQNLGKYSQKLGIIIERAGYWYQQAVPDNIKEAVGRLDYTRLATWVTAYIQKFVLMLTSSLAIILELLLIPVLAFYFLIDYRSVTSELYGFVPYKRRRDAIRFGRRVGHIMQSYVFGQIILCIIAGVLTGAFLYWMGMPYVLVLALFAGVTRAIPIIGPVVSGIPIVLVGVLNTSDYFTPMVLLIFVTIMHFAESKFIMPKLIGDRLKIHPAVVIIVLLVGAEFFGLIGMFLAAPAAAIIRIIIRHYYIQPTPRNQVQALDK